MLANLRRKMGMVPGINNPMPPEGMVGPSGFADQGGGGSGGGGVPQPMPFAMEELGFTWPSDRGMFSPSSIPLWLQEQVRVGFTLPVFSFSYARPVFFQSLADLGLPANGSDGIFLQLTGANGWTGDYAPMPEAW